MNKKDFFIVLECALLNYDGMEFEEILDKSKFDQQLIKTGIKISEALKLK